jgi:hypothetical protein
VGVSSVAEKTPAKMPLAMPSSIASRPVLPASTPAKPYHQQAMAGRLGGNASDVIQSPLFNRMNCYAQVVMRLNDARLHHRPIHLIRMFEEASRVSVTDCKLVNNFSGKVLFFMSFIIFLITL